MKNYENKRVNERKYFFQVNYFLKFYINQTIKKVNNNSIKILAYSSLEKVSYWNNHNFFNIINIISFLFNKKMSYLKKTLIGLFSLSFVKEILRKNNKDKDESDYFTKDF